MVIDHLVEAWISGGVRISVVVDDCGDQLRHPVVGPVGGICALERTSQKPAPQQRVMGSLLEERDRCVRGDPTFQALSDLGEVDRPVGMHSRSCQHLLRVCLKLDECVKHLPAIAAPCGRSGLIQRGDRRTNAPVGGDAHGKRCDILGRVADERWQPRLSVGRLGCREQAESVEPSVGRLLGKS